jgi:hypothetical protein
MTNEEFQLRMLQTLNAGPSKLARIKNANNYNKAITYSGSTQNITAIVHTATTEKGVESITQTITYENPAVEGSRITNISFN